MRWHLSNHASKRCLPMADRHYSRKKVGSRQFTPPGRKLVLRTESDDAVWVTSWPFPQYVKHGWAGAWTCSLFRNESAELASELIREAVAATRAYFGEPPDLGFVTFLDARYVEPVIVRGLPTFGYCWIKAGWKYVGKTKAGQLAFQQTPERMPPAELCCGIQLNLNGELPCLNKTSRR
jgi:hypothetical protein